MAEGSSQVDYPTASHQLNPVLRVVLICMTSIANLSQEPPSKQPRALQMMQSICIRFAILGYEDYKYSISK